MLLIDGKKPQTINLPSDLPKTVIFELVESSKGRRKTDRGYVPKNSNYLIPMRYSITDPETGQTVEVVYSGNKTIPFEHGYIPSSFQPDAVVINGEIVADKTRDAELIYALLNSVFCEDNPKYQQFPHLLKPTYRIKNLKNTSKGKLDRGKMIADALGYLTDKEKFDDRKVTKVYKAAGYADADILIGNESFDVMRSVLQEMAIQRPEDFFKVFEDGLSDVRVIIEDALINNIIALNDKGFVWGQTGTAKNVPMICKIPKGKEKREAVEILINFLKFKDDSGVYDEIKKELGV